jgi:hypothetical protein
LHAGYLCEIELVPELYADPALKQAITDELTRTFGLNITVSIVEARPGLPNRIGGPQDHQARDLVLSILRRHTDHDVMAG